MVIKEGRYGKFLACQGYPECKNTKPLTIGIPCPEDGGGLVERRSKRGKTYFTCANYPNCKFLLWYRPVAEPCPKCGAPFLVQKGGGRGRGPVLACGREGCHYRKSAEGAGVG